MNTLDRHGDLSALGAEPLSLAELFHLIRSLVPQEQQVLTIGPRAKVAEALELMRANNYSQLPVVAGRVVLGVFSYRSLATHLVELGAVKETIGALPVDEFMERGAFAQPSESWESALEALELLDAVIVGSHEHLVGILTAVDVLKYLRDIADPFVMLAEIELSLRRLIRLCTTEESLQRCVRECLESKYEHNEMPADLAEMSLNDYVQIICHGRNWPLFSRAFGEGEWQRRVTGANLRQVRELRNDVFHFRRRLTAEDRETLAKHRAWLQIKTRGFEAMRHQPAAPEPRASAGPRWNEPSFFQELQTTQGPEAVRVARQILQWARRRVTRVWWGEGVKTGTMIPVVRHGEQDYQLLAIYSYGKVEIYFQFLKAKPPFDSTEKRLELLGKLNAIEGIWLPEDAITKRPSIPLATLAEGAALDQFLKVLDWACEQIRSQRSSSSPQVPPRT